MVTEVLCTKPKEGADASIILLNNGNNVCHEVALELYELFSEEAMATGKRPLPYEPNLAYKFNNGLVFRLFDDGLESAKPRLEFLAIPSPSYKREDVLTEIPGLFKKAGIQDERVLKKLQAFIKSIAKEPPREQSH